MMVYIQFCTNAVSGDDVRLESVGCLVELAIFKHGDGVPCISRWKFLVDVVFLSVQQQQQYTPTRW